MIIFRLLFVSFFIMLSLKVWAESSLLQATDSNLKNQQDSNADNPTVETDLTLEKLVDEALKVIQKKSPQVNEDALRVWKNFGPTSGPINFTYRSWGRDLVLWLRNTQGVVFDSQEKVGEVFKILWRKQLISKNAVVVLMVDVWSYLQYLQGYPGWEQKTETKESDESLPTVDSQKSKREEQA